MPSCTTFDQWFNDVGPRFILTRTAYAIALPSYLPRRLPPHRSRG